jgi:hypothetical protein
MIAWAVKSYVYEERLGRWTRIEFGKLASCAEIRECISSEMVSKDIELFSPGERRCSFHLDARGRAVMQVGPEFSVGVRISS